MGYRERIIADGASNYWRLNDPSGTTATEIVGGVNGTISGGVTLNQPGALSDGDKAMTFDGSTGKVLTSQQLTIPLAATIEAWVKSNVNDYKTLVSNREIAATGDTIWLGTNQIFTIDVFTGALSVRGTRNVVGTGKWHHIVAVLSSNTAQLYVDGTLDASGALTRSTVGVGKIGIGCDSDKAASLTLLGSLDDVAIYPVALTPTQIAAHYAAGKASQIASWFPAWQLLKRSDDLEAFNIWEPVAPSDTVDLRRGPSGGLWVGTGGDVAAVIGNNTVPAVFASVPSGAWLPIAARRINLTGTSASGILALYQV